MGSLQQEPLPVWFSSRLLSSMQPELRPSLTMLASPSTFWVHQAFWEVNLNEI